MEAGTVVTRRIYIGAPVEVVWEWLLEPELVHRYSLADLRRRPAAPGEPLEYASRLGGQVVIAGTVHELVEGRRFVHTFQFQSEEPEAPSMVTWELLRYGSEMCLLSLRHEGLAPRGETVSSVNTSWDVILSSLKTVIETGQPLPWPSRRR